MNLYRRWIENRERLLTLRDRDRKIFPFDWGLEWLANPWPGGDPFETDGLPERADAGNGAGGSGDLEYLKDYAEKAIRGSESFFSPPHLEDWSLQGDTLTFPTPAPSLCPENNTAYCRLFRSEKSRNAVIVLPQWNAAPDSHLGLCRILRKLGITAARLCMPYHEKRRPVELRRADYAVSPNIGRTLHATRQAVLEVRQLAKWLSGQGYERIGVVGTSMGSCITYLAFVHEPSIFTGVFNHVSSFFADVVWTGLSTRYVRWGLEGHISLEDLRRCWAPISPWFFIERLKAHPRPHLLITARYDLTFRPELAQKVFRKYETHGIPYESVVLPCGHYTTATFPFKYLDGWHICRYLQRQLSRYS